MRKEYEEIVNLPHPVSQSHKPMAPLSRAAQFAPFAALTGYGELIEETGRLTQPRPRLAEDQKALLDESLAQAMEHKKAVRISFFIDDSLKDGGSSATAEGRITRIDRTGHSLQLEDGRRLCIDDIVDIELI